jgi:hypothetical protein
MLALFAMFRIASAITTQIGTVVVGAQLCVTSNPAFALKGETCHISGLLSHELISGNTTVSFVDGSTISIPRDQVKMKITIIDTITR